MGDWGCTLPLGLFEGQATTTTTQIVTTYTRSFSYVRETVDVLVMYAPPIARKSLEVNIIKDPSTFSVSQF